MKKTTPITIILSIALAFLATTYATSGTMNNYPTEYHNWFFLWGVDKITDRDKSIGMMVSTDERTQLAFQCFNGEVRIGVRTNRAFPIFDKPLITYRVDTKTPVSERWGQTNNPHMSIASKSHGLAVVQDLVGGKELYMRMQVASGVVDATFDLTHYVDVMSVFLKRCVGEVENGDRL